MNILLVFDSLSGNTKQVADIIAREITSTPDCFLDIVNITVENPSFEIMSKQYDLVLLGSWTEGRGRVPPEIKSFIMDWVTKNSNKHENVASFGTGETQFGEEYYCGAAKRIGRFFSTKYPILKIEQFVHGDSILKVKKWIRDILKYNKKEH